MLKTLLSKIVTLCGTFLVVLNGALGESKFEAHEVVMQEIRTLEVGIYLFKIDMGRFPSNEEGLDVLFYQPKNTPYWLGPYVNPNLDQLDVWNMKYVYLYPAKHGSKDFDLYSYGKNRQENFGREDDISNWGIFNQQYYNNKKIIRLRLYWIVFLIMILIIVSARWMIKNKYSTGSL